MRAFKRAPRLPPILSSALHRAHHAFGSSKAQRSTAWGRPYHDPWKCEGAATTRSCPSHGKRHRPASSSPLAPGAHGPPPANPLGARLSLLLPRTAAAAALLLLSAPPITPSTLGCAAASRAAPPSLLPPSRLPPHPVRDSRALCLRSNQRRQVCMAAVVCGIGRICAAVRAPSALWLADVQSGRRTPGLTALGWNVGQTSRAEVSWPHSPSLCAMCWRPLRARGRRSGTVHAPLCRGFAAVAPDAAGGDAVSRETKRESQQRGAAACSPNVRDCPTRGSPVHCFARRSWAVHIFAEHTFSPNA